MELFSPGRGLPSPPTSSPGRAPGADPQQTGVNEVQGKLRCPDRLHLTLSRASGQLMELLRVASRETQGIRTPVLALEPLTFVGKRLGAWVLRGHLPGPRFGLRPQSSGEPESTQKRDRYCDPSFAHAPYFRLSFPYRAEGHSYQLRMREAEASFPRGTCRFPESQSDERTWQQPRLLPVPRRCGKRKGRSTRALRNDRLRPLPASQSQARRRARARSLEFNGRERPLARP